MRRRLTTASRPMRHLSTRIDARVGPVFSVEASPYNGDIQAALDAQAAAGAGIVQLGPKTYTIDGKQTYGGAVHVRGMGPGQTVIQNGAGINGSKTMFGPADESVVTSRVIFTDMTIDQQAVSQGYGRRGDSPAIRLANTRFAWVQRCVFREICNMAVWAGNATAGKTLNDAFVLDNVIQNSEAGGFSFFGLINNLVIARNIIRDTKEDAIALQMTDDDPTFYYPNNLVIANNAIYECNENTDVRNLHDAWQASTAYSVGDTVIPTDGDETYYYECSTAGTSGGTEPTWDTNPPSGTTNDGTVVWTTKSPPYNSGSYTNPSAIRIYGGRRVAVTGNTIYDIYQSAISVDAADLAEPDTFATRVVVANNAIERCGVNRTTAGTPSERGDGIYVNGARNVALTGNQVRDALTAGIYVNNARRVVVNGNISQGNLRQGLYVLNTNDINIADNLLQDNGKTGVDTTYFAAAPYGIHLGTGNGRVKISDNVSGNSSFGRTGHSQTHGLFLATTVPTDLVITGNDLDGNATAAKGGAALSGVANRLFVKDNVGYNAVGITFASGDATPSVALWDEGLFQVAGSTAITNFDDGHNGMVIHVLGNGSVAINNGSTIKNKSGANDTPAATEMKSYKRLGGVWYEI